MGITAERAAQRQRRSGVHSQSLIELIRDNDSRTVAEIGVLDCANATKIFSACAEQIDAYYLIDPWEPYGIEGAEGEEDSGYTPSMNWEGLHQRALRLRTQYPEQVWAWRLPSVEAAQLFGPELLDLVFIDANHSYQTVKNDIDAWWPIVRVGCILAGHDYSQHYPGVVRAVDELLGQQELWFLPDTVWCVRKMCREHSL